MNNTLGNKIVLTIDMEDWFHSLDPDPTNWESYDRRIEYGTQKILELLSEKNLSATFFVLGDVAQHHPNLIRQIYNEGHEIGSHSFEHRFIYKQSNSEFREDLSKSINYLSDLIGAEIVSFRAPYFSITKNSLWALEILKEAGIKYDSSIFPIFNHRYGIQNNLRLPYKFKNGLWEWPITTYKTFIGNFPFSGGVYFRFLSRSVSMNLISKLHKKNEPVLLYFHPWEFDPYQPRLKNIPTFLKFRHYHSLKENFHKLSHVINNYTTISLKQGINLIMRDADD